MKEYEYTFEVKSLDPYKKYCENEHYELIEQGAQNRTIYRKNDGTMARITINNIPRISAISRAIHINTSINGITLHNT